MKKYENNLIIEVKNSALVLEGENEEFESMPLVSSDNVWDQAHQYKQTHPHASFVEPNLEQEYSFEMEGLEESTAEALQENDRCSINNDYETEWPFPRNLAGEAEKAIWHLKDEFSQLLSARKKVGKVENKVRIAHFDTGYDPAHITFPVNSIVRHDLERNFVEDDLPRRAVDNYSQGFMNMPGHGTGTLSLLAGNKIKTDYGFEDYIGLSENIEIIPVRISKSVVLIKNSAFVDALEYIISLYDDPGTRCHVITMSMGGAASKAWADVVNRAYEKGIFIVTAAGNNFGRLSPRTLIYPSRFNRTVAATGVTYDYSPYYKPMAIGSVRTMQGNYGPRRLMRTAVAAFTPNVPWAKIGCRETVSLAGAGTSSATPQVASAAALYFQKYFEELASLPEGWMRVEAVRTALFHSAKKEINPGFKKNDIELYFGHGILQASAMLDIPVLLSELKKEEPDTVSWGFLGLLKESIGSESFGLYPEDEGTELMFGNEILQLIQNSEELQKLLHNEEREFADLNETERQIFIETILAMPEASNTLKNMLSGTK